MSQTFRPAGLCITVILFIIPFFSKAQIGIDYHHSSLPFVGLTYDIPHNFLAEFRLSTDVDFDNISPEAIFAYKFVHQEDVDVYAGLGVRLNIIEGLVIPIGAALYPFDKKNFGFQIELAPILGESNILRGSGGIRYRFRK